MIGIGRAQECMRCKNVGHKWIAKNGHIIRNAPHVINILWYKKQTHVNIIGQKWVT